VFLRDCQDHVTQLSEMTEVYRDVCNDMREHHISLLSYKMNEVIKVLTMVSTIFIPLSFIAGVYGMNFDVSHAANMPELRSPYGYPLVLIFMGLVSAVLIAFFFRKGWLGNQDVRP